MRKFIPIIIIVIFFVTLLVLQANYLSQPTAQVISTPTQTAPIYPTPVYPKATVIFNSVNEYRTTQGKNTLKIDELLCAVALYRARESKTDWSHAGFFQLGNRLPFKQTGENLSKDFVNPIQAWINSPTHKANLDGNYRYEIGRAHV